MIIIWRGLGFLVAVIVFACSLAANFAFNTIRGEGYYDHHKWPFAVSLAVAAAICWFLGNILRKRADRIVIDKLTGKEFAVNQSKHALFFLPMHCWSPILLLIAVVLVAVEFLH